MPAFNPEQATLMDFRIDQTEATCFVYIMPFTSSKALVEYTMFSKEVLNDQEYEKQLKNYLATYLPRINYSILEKEYGLIPMTDHRFPIRQGNIISIGTAGGQTKASTGYTFNFIQKHSAALVDQLAKTGHPFLPKKRKSRHGFYDSVLLAVLSKGEVPGRTIFTRIFSKNKPEAVLRFLDNESSIADETGIISSLPSRPFLKAAWRRL
jgi:lycopene beta-cyclase